MKNNWLDDEKQKQTSSYLDQANDIIIERDTSRKILLRLFTYRFKVKQDLKLLELGCGNGYITHAIYEQFPQNHFDLLDGSPKMLEVARKKLAGDNLKFIQDSFESYLKKGKLDKKYHFIYSSNAIHHLNYLEKTALYQQVFDALEVGGMFINIDVVLPPSETCEDWSFKLWKDWMKERQVNQESGRPDQHDRLPQVYKFKEENQPTGLLEQLNVLKQIGFLNVDCYFKYGIFALFGGTK